LIMARTGEPGPKGISCFYVEKVRITFFPFFKTFCYVKFL
jgi:alkylation response protein AidB-like acyl-CoA dehydrogenase